MTETDSMVVRVAKAIRDTNANTTGLTFTELSHAMARAAIEAMKEPTPGMVDAATNVCVGFSGEFGDINEYCRDYAAENIWHIMTEKALEE